MVSISRKFSAIEYGDEASPDEFPEMDPLCSRYTVVHINKPKNRLHIIDHHSEPFRDDVKSVSQSFEISASDWNDVNRLTEMLKRFKDLPGDIRLATEVQAEEVEMGEIEFLEDDIRTRESNHENLTVFVNISSGVIEFGLRPEPTSPIFPAIPVGDEFSLEGGSSNQINLDRFVEMLEEAKKGIELESSKQSDMIDDQIHMTLNDLKYGYEVIKHTQDGDICVENDLLHLALSSYIHALEWAVIAYLEDNGKDIIKEEKNGALYYFAEGKNNILDELDNVAEIDQKTISKIRSMNRAERRWMAHHKTGKVLPEEVEAIRARLNSLLNELF